MSNKLIGWNKNGILYWAGSMKDFTDLYTKLHPYKKIVYLGDDPEFRYYLGELGLEELISDIEFEKEGNKYITNSKEDAKKLYEFLKLEQDSPEVFYKKGDKEKKYVPRSLKLASAGVIGTAALLIGAAIYVGINTHQPEFNLKVKMNNYTFDKSKTPVEKVKLQVDSQYLNGGLSEILIKNRTAEIPIWLSTNHDQKTALTLLNVYQDKVLVFPDNSSVYKIQVNTTLCGKYNVLVKYLHGREEIKETIGNVTLVAPPYYNVTKDGNLIKLTFYSENRYFDTPGFLSLGYMVNGSRQAFLLLGGIGDSNGSYGDKWVSEVNITIYGNYDIVTYKEPQIGNVYLYFMRDKEKKLVEIS